MPLYTYSCEEHGSFDKLKKISDRKMANCPECDKECHQSLSVPAMVKGGYMDSNMSVTKGISRKM